MPQALTFTDRLINTGLSVFLIVGMYQLYFWCQRNALVSPRELNSPLDDRLPYWPSWVWIYSFLYYPVILYLNFTVESHRQFTCVAGSYLLLLAMQVPFFLMFPLSTPARWREYNLRRTLSERFLAFVHKFDGRTNSFPSMHTSVAVLTGLHLSDTFRLGEGALVFPVLIALSCIFTKQHYLFDVPAGAALGWAAFESYRMLYA